MKTRQKNKINKISYIQVLIIIILLSFLSYQIIQALTDSNTANNSNSFVSIIVESSSQVSSDLELTNKYPSIKSSVDFDNNGIDDYTDILKGAKKEALDRPIYEDVYWDGGYPPDGTGVCTDVIWRAFKNAGYNLKEMIDQDIARYPWEYNLTYGNPDPNIDFRRVPNQKIFFSKYAISLTTDTSEVEKWQPGDIVVYGDRHIAIISNLRNKDGVPFIIHNSDDHDEYEEDFLDMEDLSEHYRFDASKIPSSVLVGFD